MVGRIEAREITGKKVNADGGGIDFNQQGDLFIAAAPFGEVVRVRGSDLNPAKPGVAQTFATGDSPALTESRLTVKEIFLSQAARSGIVYRVGANGGAAQTAAQIEKHSRTLPDGKTQQATVANGLAFDAKGVLCMLPTRRGGRFGRWRSAPTAKAARLRLLAQSPLLEGADGLAFDRSGKLWVAANERNALVTVAPDGQVQEIAKNDSHGPLEFPAAIVFVGDTAYIANLRYAAP